MKAGLKTPPGRRLRPRNISAILASGEEAGTRQLHALLAGKLTALSAPGGGEVQMASTLAALPALGVDARPWRPWEQAVDEADVLHLFGSQREHLPVVAAARRAGVPVVLSTIAWFDLASRWREPGPLAVRLAACGKQAARSAAPWLPSWRRRLYRACDLLLPNSQAEAEQLARYFGVATERMHIVPNGADLRFAQADPRPFARLVGGRGFVLYAGRIEPRKNQLGFLRAMRASDVPIVVLGDAVPGCEAYLAECQRVAGPNVRFLGRLDHGDALLASAYAACGCLVLASWFETPGLAALEAGMSGTPLVLTRGGCTREYFGNLAHYVSPGDPHEIRQQVLAARTAPRRAELAELLAARYSWHAAAQATRAAYEKALDQRKP